MQQYDVTLKVLPRTTAKRTVMELVGTPEVQWLDTRLSEVRSPEVDLLGETGDGSLVHIELQSKNDPTMPIRMAEYYFGIRRLLSRFPRQILLYVGEPPLRMDTELSRPEVWFQYRAVDIRSLDGERLLESPETGDNIIAILAQLRDQREAVRRIVARIASMPTEERKTALRELLILAGLRRLEKTVEQEAEKVPVFIDILENEVLGREFKRGLLEGKLEGLREGELKGLREGELKGLGEGKLEGELAILRRLIEKRFGPVPGWAEERLSNRNAGELEDLSVRLLDAPSLEELLK